MYTHTIGLRNLKAPNARKDPKRLAGFKHLHFARCRLKLADALQCRAGKAKLRCATLNGSPLPLFDHHHSIRQSAEFCVCICLLWYLYLYILVFVFGWTIICTFRPPKRSRKLTQPNITHTTCQSVPASANILVFVWGT